MVTLAVAMIVRDEEAVLGRLLGDVAAFADEVVVVDTGSTDGTVELARAAGARVLHVPWTDDFAAARNASFAACTADWVLWLDADDRLPVAVQERLGAWKTGLLQEDGFDAVAVPYLYHWSADGERCEHRFHRERLLRLAARPVWSGRVHEVVDVAGPVLQREDVWVEHRPDPSLRPLKSSRNLRILQGAYDGGDRSLRTLLYLGNELRDAGRAEEALALYGQYLELAPVGWERYTGLVSAARCARSAHREQEAEDLALRAVREAPERAEAWLLVGQGHFDRGDWEAAVPWFSAATALRPPPDGFVEPSAYGYAPWDYLAVCFQRLGRGPEALQALARAVDGNPERARLADNAAWTVRTWTDGVHAP